MRSRLLASIAIVSVSFVGCRDTEQAKVIGLTASVALSEAVAGEIRSLYYEGSLVLERSNGERVEALCETRLIDDIRGGQMVEIEFDEELDSWRVAKIMTPIEEERGATFRAISITEDPHTQRLPDISGDRIVWQDRRDSDWDIYLYDLATRTETRMTTNPSDQRNPAIDGNRIVWQDNRHGNWDIYLYDLRTRAETRITNEAADQYYPAVSGALIGWTEKHPDRPVAQGYGIRHIETGGHTTVDCAAPSLGTCQQTSHLAIDGDRVIYPFRKPDYEYVIVLRDMKTGSVTEFAHGSSPSISGDIAAWVDIRQLVVWNLATQTSEMVQMRGSGARTDASGDWVVWEERAIPNPGHPLDSVRLHAYDVRTGGRVLLFEGLPGKWDAYHNPRISDRRVVWAAPAWPDDNWDIYLYGLPQADSTGGHDPE